MPKLVIVESFAKARTINRYLGKGYRVEACMGHVRDLPPKRIGVDTENEFRPEYEVLPDREKIVRQLRKAAQKAEEVYLATDLDREGEAIAWHLMEALKLNPEGTRRVVFNEITESAIREAFASPRGLDMDKVNAQQARRILDRIVGYRLSPLLWRKLSPGLSAGRVQSVAVRLIVEREREIRSFKPEEYWRLTATVCPARRRKDKFELELKKLDGEEAKVRNEGEARALVEELSGAEYGVTRFDKRRGKQAPPPPFNTSTLQQQASIQLRFSTKRTMLIAQGLYEGVELGAEGAVGLITYMRTDSLRVADQAIAECRRVIGETVGEEYLPAKPNAYRSGKASQGAHEAVRPTSAARTPEQVRPHLPRDQFALYELIWKRFVASQMKPAEWALADVEVTAGRGLFATQGKTLVFDGFLKVAGFDPKEEVHVPALQVGQVLELIELNPTQHFTKPPPRYTEASLVKTLEKLGIGRPSTYSPIISTIQERRYVRQEKRKFYATELAEMVTDQLVKHFPDIMNVKFTSNMEEKLDGVEEQHLDWIGVLRDFYEPFRSDMERAEKEMSRPAPEPTDEKCPECGEPLVVRWSRRGSFVGCSTYPKCAYTRDLAQDSAGGEALPEVKENCPECDKPLTVRRGRRGPFIGCTGYPKCTYTRDLNPPQAPAGAVCEKCGKPMIVRRGRRGAFLGCSGYPECRTTRPLPRKNEAPEGESATAEDKGAEPAEGHDEESSGARDLGQDAAKGEPLPEVKENCPECGRPLSVKRGRRGPFIGCAGYPKCTYTRDLSPPQAPADAVCEKCGKPMVVRRGPKGPFLGCSGYPKCRTSRPLPRKNEAPENESSTAEDEGTEPAEGHDEESSGGTP